MEKTKTIKIKEETYLFLKHLKKISKMKSFNDLIAVVFVGAILRAYKKEKSKDDKK